MIKRPFVQTVICFVLGILWGILKEWYLPVCLLFLLGKWQIDGWRFQKSCRQTFGAEMEYPVPKRKKTTGYLVAWTLCGLIAFFMGNLHMMQQITYREVYLPYVKDGTNATICGSIYKKETKNEEYHIYLKDVSLQIGSKSYQTNQVLVHLSTDEYPIGTTLLVNGTIQRFRQATNEGGYEEEQYYAARKIDYGLYGQKVLGCYGQGKVLSESLYQLKNKLKQSIISNANEEDAGVLSVMVLGEKSLLDEEVKALYQRAGISHILVISGLHISMIGMGIYNLLKKLKQGIIFSALISAIFLLCYADMIGGGASTIRAVSMFLVGMGGRCLGRTYDKATGLALAVLMLLVQNPFLLMDAGFLFSVAAVLGVICAEKWKEAWKVNGMIQLFTLPLVAYYYYEIPVYSLLVNLFVLSLVTPLLVLGMCGSIVGVFWQWGAKLLLLLAHVILVLIEKAGNIADMLPFSSVIVGQPMLWQICIYYILLILLVKYISKYRSNENPKEERVKKADKKKRIRNGMVSGIGVCVLWVLLTLRLPHNTKIDVLDVGQGDGICIQTKEGINLFVDGGSSDVKQVGTYRIEPYLKFNGIKQIDYWFVSHCDTDHVSGLLELLENGYEVKHLIVGRQSGDNQNWKKLKSLAKEENVEIYTFETGDVLRMQTAKMSCIYAGDCTENTDTNAASLVLLYEENGFQGMFTGDIGSKQEQEILQMNKTLGLDLKKIDFYKVAHHGSKYSNSMEFLQLLEPEIAVISCGANNSYGHPHEETLERLEAAGCQIWSTVEGGQIMVETHAAKGTVDGIRDGAGAEFVDGELPRPEEEKE